jgi:hypothetical protein
LCGRLCAAFAQDQVIGTRPPLVAVAFDQDVLAGLRLQKTGVGFEPGPGIIANHKPVKVKKDIG